MKPTSNPDQGKLVQHLIVERARMAATKEKADRFGLQDTDFLILAKAYSDAEIVFADHLKSAEENYRQRVMDYNAKYGQSPEAIQSKWKRFWSGLRRVRNE